MIFIKESEVTVHQYSNEHFMAKIELNKNSTRKLIEHIGQNNLDKEALNILNKLGQNLELLDTRNYMYINLGNKLSISELSRGESVFLVSYASMISKTPIWLQYDIMQLTKTSLRKYYELFECCEYINIIYDSQATYDYLTMAMRGEIL